MAVDNLISVSLTQEEQTAINEAIASINTILKGKVVNLTPDERRQYGSIADRNRVLVDKCKWYMEENPETIPNVIDMDEFQADYTARLAFEKPLKNLARVVEKLQDTKTLLDHDNYNVAIAYYRYIRFLAGQNEAGTTAIYNDLKSHYQSRSTAKQDPETVSNSQKTEQKD